MAMMPSPRRSQAAGRQPTEQHTVESLAIRIMPSTAATGVQFAASHQPSASAPSACYKEGTLRWQQGAKNHRARRCLLSAMTAVLVSVAVLVVSGITAVWVPSAVMANDELVKASKDQLLSSAEQISKELLGYLQVASSQAQVVGSMYNMSFAVSPDSAPAYFLDNFGQGTWSLLKQSPTLSSVLLAQKRDPDSLRSETQDCNTDVVLIAATYKANLNRNTTGTGWTGNENELKLEASDEAPAGQARMNNIMGDLDIADPMRFNSTKFFKDCAAWLGNGENLWKMQNLPGTWASEDSGVREAVWLPGTVVAGAGADQALYKKVFFPLKGPEWANQTAFGAISVRVGSRAINGAAESTLSMKDILQQVAARTERDTLLFVLTAEGSLLATSKEDQPVELLDGDGGLSGLLPGDSDLVQDPIAPVARELLAGHCNGAGEDRRCDWASVDPMREINGYYVSSKIIIDPQAKDLNMLLVNMASVQGITAPSRQLNEDLSKVSSTIILFACLLSIGLSRVVTLPFRAARDNMFLLGDMRVEDALQRNTEKRTCCRWSFTEVADLRLSFHHAATCLKAWREHELDRRMQLEEERTSRISKTVEKAVRGAGKLVHPMVLISAESFSKLEQLTSYEELRNTSKLVFLDTEEALASFKADHSIIFLSHQWLAWGFPDNSTKTHLGAMKNAIRRASQQVGGEGASGRCSWENTYVWVDYCSIAQDHRGMQMLAVSSLPVYASSADIFVIVAPPAEHQCSRHCDLQSYNARGWCRAEMLAKICSSGLENFFISGSSEGDLEQVTEERLPSLSMFVFEGEFSCCQQKHIKSSCDKEALVEPVLGLYSLVLRQIRAGTNRKNMQPILKYIRDHRDRFFPAVYTFHSEGARPEERELFGPLVEATEAYVQELNLPDCAVSFNSLQQQRSIAASKAPTVTSELTQLTV